MPIICPISLPRLTSDEFSKLDYAVMSHVFASHKALGRLADEKIYQGDLAARLLTAGLPVRREMPVTAVFRTFQKTYFMDMVISDKAVYELKAVAALNAEHEGQLLNYLLLLDIGRGKLVNFRSSSVESRFVNATLPTHERRRFAVDDSGFHGDTSLRDLFVELLRDLGTSLALSIYQEALLHMLGGAELVTHFLPLHREGIHLGNQSFHLVSPDSAFRITALKQGLPAYGRHLKNLLACSPLKSILWINISHRKVTFTSIH